MEVREENVTDWDVDYYLITFEAANGDVMAFPPFESNDEEAKSKFYAIKDNYKNMDIKKHKSFFVQRSDPERLELLNRIVPVSLLPAE